MKVEITFDHRDWDALLRAWQEPAVRKTLGAAASSFGRAAKPIIRAEIPAVRPGNPYATGAGSLRNQVRFKRIRRSHGVGVVIGPMGKLAYYRRFVAGGTKPHVILPKRIGGRLAVLGGFASAVHHPGAKANDFIARAESRAVNAGNAAAETAIFKGLAGETVTEFLDS